MKIPIFIMFLLGWVQAHGQEQSAGPVIDSFGQVYLVERPDVMPVPDLTYRAIFDIYGSSDAPEEINPQINTLARFLNMHAQAGVAVEQLKVAGVFHGEATLHVIDDPTYRSIFGVDNPNRPLLEELDKAGVDLVLCGQSMHSSGLHREQLAPGIQVALSAMTAILNYHDKGYVLIKF